MTWGAEVQLDLISVIALNVQTVMALFKFLLAKWPEWHAAAESLFVSWLELIGHGQATFPGT